MTAPTETQPVATGRRGRLRQALRSLYYRSGLYRLGLYQWLTRGRRPAAAERQRPPICNDLRLWCAEHPQGRYEAVLDARPVTRRLPRTTEPEVDSSFYSLLNFDVPERVFVSVANARLAGRDGLVVLPDGSFVGETVALTPAGRQRMLDEQSAYAAPLPTRRLSERYVLLMTIGWANYYHWNHDVIMRLQPFIDRWPAEARCIVPADLRPFHLASLDKVLGIGEDRLVRFPGNEAWEVEHLSFASPIYKTQIDMPEPLVWFRERCQQAYGVEPGSLRRRIYLTRDQKLDSHYRVTNPAEVEELMAGYGFECVYPGLMTFQEQVELFSQAEAIVGTGTGLANMVFAPPPAKIIQIQEPSSTIHALWTMSEALGHEYWYFRGESVGNPGQDRPDIFVPMVKLEACMNAMLGKRSASVL